MRKPYPTDLTDEQWDVVAPILPPARGRRTVDIREVVNAILYITRSGCQWRMLPHEFPNYRTVHDYHTRWQFNGTWRKLTDTFRRQVRRESLSGHKGFVALYLNGDPWGLGRRRLSI